MLLAGLAGLAAGAFSMAAGEYTSVASQSEFALAQIEIERHEIEHNGPAEEAELAAMYVEKGVDEDTARDAAAQIHRDVDNAVEVHAREEFGVDANDLASPRLAAVSSFFSFALGAAPAAPAAPARHRGGLADRGAVAGRPVRLRRARHQPHQPHRGGTAASGSSCSVVRRRASPTSSATSSAPASADACRVARAAGPV